MDQKLTVILPKFDQKFAVFVPFSFQSIPFKLLEYKELESMPANSLPILPDF
jgi:hypothetical protein